MSPRRCGLDAKGTPETRIAILNGAARCHLELKQFDRAIETIRSMTNPHMALRVLTASYSHLGREKEAKQAADVLRTQHPDFSASAWADIVPDRDSADTELLVEGLRIAGL